MAATGNFLKYTMLPGVLPRCLGLFKSTFSFSAYSIACIFYSVRLLPPTHSYVQQENMGKFGIRHVIAAAGDNIDFKWKNIDQITVFVLMLSAIVLLMAQFVLMGISLVAQQPALAGPADYFLRTEGQHIHDLVMVTLDRVFGVPGIFNSCVSVAAEACQNMSGVETVNHGDSFPFPLHYALHGMLNFYSLGIFMIAGFVILYFITVIVGETAVSGSPMGQRYNKAWVPLRIILFFALLIPIPQGGDGSDGAKARGEIVGMNAAQYLTLWVARTGSDFASNGWEVFTDEIYTAHMSGSYGLVAEGNVPRFDELLKFLFVARTCKTATEVNFYGDAESENWIRPYVVRSDSLAQMINSTDSAGEPWLDLVDTTYEDALLHTNHMPLTIVFGARVEDEESPFYDSSRSKLARVMPFCGELQFPAIGTYRTSQEYIANDITVGTILPGHKIQELYYELIKTLWSNDSLISLANCNASYSLTELSVANVDQGCEEDEEKFSTRMVDLINSNQNDIIEQYREILDEHQENSAAWGVPDRMKDRGWAAAALLYQEIAKLNGQVTESLLNLPDITAMPSVMEYVSAQKQSKEEAISEQDKYDVLISGSEYVDFDDIRNANIARALNRAYQLFNGDVNIRTKGGTTTNFIEGFIEIVLGAGGIFDIRRNADVNPMGQLSALGRSIMDASIRNIAGGFLLDKALGEIFGTSIDEKSMKTITGAIQNIGYTTMTIGFSLYYVLPIMPFLYFFFAFAGWVKSIFEAIVAMPLWAMSHIARWDGDGIAGPSAENGYFLLFEIFVRPIMILFGLIASISIFSASVLTLNEIFDMAVSAISGEDLSDLDVNLVDLNVVGSAVDELFMTAVYTVLCYMIGLSSFKLIDQIPHQILRWMGSSASAFQDNHQSMAESISGKAYKGGTLTSNKLSGMTTGAGELSAMS